LELVLGQAESMVVVGTVELSVAALQQLKALLWVLLFLVTLLAAFLVEL
jgi:hypothetical protein